MTFKLTSAELHALEELESDLDKAWDATVGAVIEYNKTQALAQMIVDTAVSRFNRTAELVKSFTDAIAERAQEQISTHSDAWRDSDSGEAARLWRDEWRHFYIEELDPVYPKPLHIDKPYMDLDNLSEEAA